MEILKRERKYSGYYQLDLLHLRSRESQREVNREQFLIPNSVGILVFNTQKQKVVLVKQFRIGPEKELIEIVAGKLEGKDKNPENTAHREVEEETGYRVNKLEAVYQFYTSPGPVNEKMSFFYAEVSEQVAEGGGLDSEVEEIEILEWDVSDFLNHQFEDAKTIMAQLWLRLKLASGL